MNMAAARSPAVLATAAETVPVVFKPEMAKRTFAKEDVVLAYHGNLLYEAVVEDVIEDAKSGTVYDLRYQGWMKSWNSRVLAQYVFEHNDNNLIIAHQLLRSAKARQQAVAPVTHGNFTQPMEYEERCELRNAQFDRLNRPTQPEPTHPVMKFDGYAGASPAEEEDDMTRRFPGMWDRPRSIQHEEMLQRDRPTPDTTPGVSDDATNTPRSECANGIESEVEEESTSASLFYLPGTLKQQLVDDWEFVTKENRLVPLPRKESVAMIIDKWVRHRERSEDLACQEVADGLKAYFDAALPNMLLYKFERLQYNMWFHGAEAKAREQDEDDPRPSKFYGAEHLVRLLLKMPFMLESTGVVDQDMLRRIAEKTNELAQFLTDNGRLLFLPAYTKANAEYVDRVARGAIGGTPVMNGEQAQQDGGEAEGKR